MVVLMPELQDLHQPRRASRCNQTGRSKVKFTTIEPSNPSTPWPCSRWGATLTTTSQADPAGPALLWGGWSREGDTDIPWMLRFQPDGPRWSELRCENRPPAAAFHTATGAITGPIAQRVEYVRRTIPTTCRDERSPTKCWDFAGNRQTKQLIVQFRKRSMIQWQACRTKRGWLWLVVWGTAVRGMLQLGREAAFLANPARITP